MQYIAAHLSKIHGLDWSPDSETDFATSSQDGTVKVCITFISIYTDQILLFTSSFCCIV